MKFSKCQILRSVLTYEPSSRVIKKIYRKLIYKLLNSVKKN